MNQLWTPPGSSAQKNHWMNNPTQREMEVDSRVELYDHDILDFERGPLAWANQQAGKSLNIDQFTKDLTEQFGLIGFGVEVQVWETNQRGVYAFKVVIEKRLGEKWDPDRQVHEVVNNLLDIPGDEKGKTIDTGKAMLEMERQEKERGTRGHDHD